MFSRPNESSRSETTVTLPRLGLGIVLLALASPSMLRGQEFTRADTLRGSNGPARAWWDVTYYDLNVRIDPGKQAIEGWNAVTFDAIEARSDPEWQIDLQAPLAIDSVVLSNERLPVRSEGSAHFVTVPGSHDPGDRMTIAVHYSGKPIVAERPPWDGGFIWAEQERGEPWVATANQGLGASVWWPNKDYQGEEPDSQRVALTVPDPMVNVSNGRLRGVTPNADGTSTYEWFVASPINNYAIAVNAARFAHWQEVYDGLEGPLTLDFWPLEENESRAREQWTQTQPMLECFEHWFGPFPWYEDGFKMIESPHLGMEHQSAIAYGNGYQNGYLGRDLSGSGEGMKWDFIIVHEAAHEWWGNNITTEDVADMWVHESFANYSENLYTECLTGSKAAGAAYVIGSRRNILNDAPVQGVYGVQSEGSSDMYYKGGSMLHTIRQLIADDELWRSILHGLNRDFARQIVTGAQVERYIARESGLDLDRVFEQYLRSPDVPALEWRLADGSLHYRWADVVEGFDMPVRVILDEGGIVQREGAGAGGGDAAMSFELRPTPEWQTRPVEARARGLQIDPDYYAVARRMP
jgi:aminopeptidase N